MNIIIPLDAMWRFEERTPAVMAEVRNLLKANNISLDVWHGLFVDEFDRLYAMGAEEWPSQIAMLADRVNLTMPQGHPTAEEMEEHVQLLEAYVCALYGALWPFLQTLGYDDGNVPSLRFIRHIGPEAILVSDPRERAEESRALVPRRFFSRPRL